MAEKKELDASKEYENYLRRVCEQRRLDWEARDRERVAASRAAKQAQKNRDFLCRKRLGPPNPLSREYRRDIKPLRSKPLARRIAISEGNPPPKRRKSKRITTPRAARPLSFSLNKLYEDNGWFCCGYCKKAAENRASFDDHLKSKTHKSSVLLQLVPEDCRCSCGKVFNDKTHAHRHSEVCPKVSKNVLKDFHL